MNNHWQNDRAQTGSSIFGLISIGICVVSLVTIRLFLSMILLGIVIFAIIGLIRDSAKIWSVAALIWAGFLVFGESEREASKSKVYEVTFKVDCASCKVEHTNGTGGKDEFNCSPCSLNTKVRLRGDEYVSLSAFANDDNNGSVSAQILVDGLPLKQEQSNGDRAHVYLTGFPKDVATH